MWKVVERKCDATNQQKKSTDKTNNTSEENISSICLAAVATFLEGTITHRIGRRRQNTISLRTDRAAAVRGSFRLTVICKKKPHFITFIGAPYPFHPPIIVPNCKETWHHQQLPLLLQRRQLHVHHLPSPPYQHQHNNHSL